MLTLVESTTGPLLARLGASEIDVAVVSAYPGRTLETGRFTLHHLMDDPLLVAMPEGAPAGG